MREKRRWRSGNDEATLVEWPDSDRLSITAQPSMTGSDGTVSVGIDIPERLLLLPEMHNPDHDAPFALFTQAMADELRANAGKGDRAAWMADTASSLLAEVHHHLAKLHIAANELERHRAGRGIRPTPWGGSRAELESLVREFAADTANMAMMLADNMGVLA